MESKKRRYSMELVWGLFFLYTISTFAKINYSASISYILKEGIFSKTNSGIISSAFYLTYGIGQLFGAKIIDKYSPYSVELVSLICSLLCNIALCFSYNYVWVLIIWSLNGLALYASWPGAVRMVAECVADEHRKMATSLLTISIAVGGILSYTCVSALLEAFGWSGMFIMNSVVTFLFVLVWIGLKMRTEKYLYVKKEPQKAKKVETSENLIRLVFRSGVAIIFVICLIRAMLDNGLKAWIPTMMVENYEISTIWAGMQTAIIYICNMLSSFVMVPMLLKLGNEMKMMALLYIISVPFMVVLIYIGKIPQLVAVVAFIIITSLTYVLTTTQVSVSSKFADTGVGHSGAIAALLNAFASFGVLLSTTLFGYVAESYNWQAVIYVCIGFVVLAIILLIPAYHMWKKFLNSTL